MLKQERARTFLLALASSELQKGAERKKMNTCNKGDMMAKDMHEKGGTIL